MDRARKMAAAMGFILIMIGAEGSAQGGPRLFERADLNRDGAISLSEMRALRARRMFRLDRDGDGRISRQEFIALRPDRFRGNPPPWIERRRARIFQRLDRNGDGLIDRAEGEASLRRWFARMDANGDGLVTPPELMTARARMRDRIRRAGPRGRFARLDTNGDGVISFDEFHNARADRMQALDRNRDQRVSREEFMAADPRGGIGSQRRAGLFVRLDRNGDGYITPVENAAAVEAWFRRRDRNGDGRLTRNEFTAPRVVRRQVD